jgi:hypothetical protein
MDPEAQTMYAIVHKEKNGEVIVDDDGNTEYWSNEWGWVEGDMADLYTDNEHQQFTLPIEGEWEEV